jgi:hypothetical protein
MAPGPGLNLDRPDGPARHTALSPAGHPACWRRWPSRSRRTVSLACWWQARLASRAGQLRLGCGVGRGQLALLLPDHPQFIQGGELRSWQGAVSASRRQTRVEDVVDDPP